MLTQRLPTIVSLMLILAISYAAYFQLAPVIQEDSAINTLQQINSSNVSKEVEEPKSKVYNISKLDLFGNIEKSAKKEDIVPETLPTTPLQLKLTGILSTDQEVLTGALIEGPNRDTLYYKPGDTLPGDATLKQVHPDRVVIERSGRFENLYFPKEFSSVAFTSYEEPPEQAFSDDSGYNEENEESEEPNDSNTPEVSEARKQSIKDRLSKLRSRLKMNR